MVVESIDTYSDEYTRGWQQMKRCLHKEIESPKYNALEMRRVESVEFGVD